MNELGWRSYVVIAVLAFTAYAPTLRVGFLWDDHVIIENNPYIQKWTWENVKHDFGSDNTQGQGDNYYRPFQAFSHRIDYSLWGLNPFGYHLSDLLVHIANGFLLYQFVIALGFTPLVGLMTACLFVVNPIGVEQFIIPSGRTTPLSFFFCVSSIVLLLQEGPLFVVLALLSYSLALLTKETSVITPALVVLVFYFKKVPWKQWWLILPMLVLTGSYFVLRNRAVHYVVGDLDPSLLFFFLYKVFPRILWHYICLILWPWNLHSHRLIPHLSHIWFLYLAALIGGIGWSIWKKNDTALLCIGWMVLGLSPAIPVMIRGSFMLDHWGYPIALGILLPTALLFIKGWQAHNQALRHFSGILYCVVIIVWSLLVHLNVALRGTDEKMYRWALNFTTSNPIKYNLGLLLMETGRPREAVNYFEEVRAAHPEDSNNMNALALAYWKMGHHWLAINLLEVYAKSYPNDVLTQRRLQMLETLQQKK